MCIRDSPGVRVNLPAITEKDKRDIKFGIQNKVDFIALSFVREASDIKSLQTLLGEDERGTKIIAKLEDQEAIKKYAGNHKSLRRGYGCKGRLRSGNSF